MAQEHPEIREARDQFEISLENYVQLNVVNPPAHIKSKILSAIDMEGHETAPSFSGGSTTPPPVIAATGDGYSDGRSLSKVGVKKEMFSKILAAAAVILLLMSTALNFYFFNRYKEYN